MKVQTPLGKATLEIWALALDRYPAPVLNRCCIRLGLSVDPFPDLGKLVQACEETIRRESGQVHRGEPGEVPETLLTDVASRFGLEVSR